MKIVDVEQCSFEKWYPSFKKVTVKSIILPLPDGFVNYILKDGIVLPKNTVLNKVSSDDSDTNDIEDTWEDSGEPEAEAPHFPDFDDSIKTAIHTLGGEVFPKLNWSSPKDASWIAFNNSCCCTSVSDVYLLLKSSDFIIHDLTQPFKKCEDFKRDGNGINIFTEKQSQEYYLVLRKWIDLDVSGEFRCFVKNNNLLGISQREYTLYFDHIHFNKDEILEDILTFFKRNIQNKFLLCDYVFDIYHKKKDHVLLIDFNPFGTFTESLLFSWAELNSDRLVPDSPVFRYISDNCGVQPRSLSFHALPRDIVDISTGEDSFKLVDLMKMKIEEQNDSSADEEVKNKS